MSGGSLCYVYAKMNRGEIDDFLSQTPFIIETLHRLQHGTVTPVSADDIAKVVAAIGRYRKVISAIAEIQIELPKLADIAKAIEWYLSGDWGPEEIITSVRELPEAP